LAISALCFHPDGGLIAAVTGRDVLLINGSDCSVEKRQTVASSDLLAIKFGPQGDLAVCVSEEGEVTALDSELQSLWSMKLDAMPQCLQFEPISGNIYVGTNLGDLFVLGKNGNLLENVRVPESIRDVGFIHNSRHVLVGCRNMDVHLFANSSLPIVDTRVAEWEAALEKKQTSFYTSTASLTSGRIFISYSSRDKTFAAELEANLTKDGFSCWRDEHALTSGRITKQLQRAILSNDVVLVVLSEASLASDWVRWELDSARTVEKTTGRDLICPIAIDSSWQSWAEDPVLKREVLKYHVVGFGGWQSPEAFAECYQKLTLGLKQNYLDQPS
jgi:TIR domain